MRRVTWICDQCGRHKRGQKPEGWLEVGIRVIDAIEYRLFDFATGGAKAHVCSSECARALLADEEFRERSFEEVAA